MELSKKVYKNLISILSKPNRSFTDIDKIVSFIETLSDLKPFLSSASKLSLEELAESVIMVKYSDKQVIFNKGDHSDKLFIVLKGTISLYDVLKSQELVLINTLTKGKILGERGPIRNLPRSLTAIAKKDVILAILNVFKFRSILSSQIVSNFEEKVKFIDQKFPKTHGFRGYQKEKLAFCIDMKQYRRDEVILEEGKNTDYLIIIYSGECLLLKSNVFKPLKVLSIGTGCIIAEECIFLDSVSQFSYKVTSDFIKLYFIKKQNFFIQAPSDLVRKLKNICVEKVKNRNDMLDGARRIARNNSFYAKISQNLFQLATPIARIKISNSLNKSLTKGRENKLDLPNFKNNKEKLTKLRERFKRDNKSESTENYLPRVLKKDPSFNLSKSISVSYCR